MALTSSEVSFEKQRNKISLEANKFLVRTKMRREQFSKKIERV